MTETSERDAIVQSLIDERLVDIVTTGARSGQLRRHEIWITNAAGCIHLCGMPRFREDGSKQPRDWVANLTQHPDLVVCLKESVRADLTARARPVTDSEDRYRLSQTPAMAWYRDHSPSLEAMLANSPMFALTFTGECAWLNAEGLLAR